MNRRLLIVVNTTEFFLSHRLPIALAAKSAGYDVHIATGTPDTNGVLAINGFTHHLIPISRTGVQVAQEFQSIVAVTRLLRRLKPQIIHLVTIKPVLYVGIAARFVRAPMGIVAAISGLGMVFTQGRLRKRLIRLVVANLYQFALNHDNLRVIFQNTHDIEVLNKVCHLQNHEMVLIPGSGVALKDYPHKSEPDENPVVITFAARLIKDKGVYEFVEAASIIKDRGIKARFLLVGGTDPDNPSSVSENDIKQWREEDAVEVLGHSKNIVDIFTHSHIICLPSYYGEGLPKVLIEAAACGRPVVTTDHPGCRDAIIADKTGLLVPPRDSVTLAERLVELIKSPALRESMGRAGRALAEEKFTIENVVEQHLSIYQQLSKSARDTE